MTSQVRKHNKQREIEAVSRKSTAVEGDGTGGWLLNVPFPGTGMSNTRISLGEIFNFAISVSALDPAPGDWVLDLGAGPCWVSEWLNRLLVNTVSLDISHDMLAIGQRRLGPGASLTVGDFEALPFSDRVLDGAICLSALHHVPNIPRALREIRRVLKDDAAVVFSEPGIGHAAHPQSRAEMSELGVMERDIVVTELMDECREAGFQHVSVFPHLFPPPSYDYAAWRSIQQASQPTTIFSLKTLWQMAAELTPFGSSNWRLAWKRLMSSLPQPRLLRRGGAAARYAPPPASPPGSQGQTTAEALLCWQSLLTLRNAVEIHPVLLARKGWRQPDSRRPGILRAEIAAPEAPPPVTAGASFTIRARVRNTGDSLWLSKPTPLGGFVALGAKLVDTSNLIVIHNYGRGVLSRDLAPGGTLAVEITLNAPEEPGQYRVKLDMVDECVAWFEHLGTVPAFVPLEVRPVH